MKKLNKLQINSERLMKNKDLISLRGGSWEGNCEVMCDWGYFNGDSSGTNCSTAEMICEGMYDCCTCDCGCNY